MAEDSFYNSNASIDACQSGEEDGLRPFPPLSPVVRPSVYGRREIVVFTRDDGKTVDENMCL